MKSFSRYLTISNVLSWPVIFVSTVSILFGNLVDSSLNGTENIPLRVFLVLLTQAFFFGALFLSNRLLIRRFVEASRWIVLWISIAVLSMVRATLYSLLLEACGSDGLTGLGPRVLAGLSNLALLMVLVTVIYGMLTETALQRRQLSANRQRLIELQDEIAGQKDQNEVHLERVRKELAETLAPELLDTPENTLTALRSSIDEVIRPLTQSLNQQIERFENGTLVVDARVDWRGFLVKLCDLSEYRVAPGVALFMLSILTSLARMFTPEQAVILFLLIALQLVVTTSAIRWLLVTFVSSLKSWALPIVLALSAGVGAALFSPVIPTRETVIFIFSYIWVYVFFGLLPVAVKLAREESREMSRVIKTQQSELDWEIARANEISQRHNRVIATALHGHAQAVLAAAALRLQLALNAGVDQDEAMKIARKEAEKVIIFNVNVDEPSLPLVHTLEEVSALWKGISEISSDIDEGTLVHMNQDAVCSRLCAELVMELCVNAIKHGKASHIFVSLNFHDERTVALSISNDGEEFNASTSGFGTRLLNESCVNWSQERREGKTFVVALLPWRGMLS